MMRLVLLLGSTPAFAGGFGGAELGASVELDPNGAAYLMDLDVESYRQINGENRLVWAPFSFAFVLGESNPLANIDYLDVAALTGVLSFGNTLAEATYGLGMVHWDSDAQLVDLTAANGGVSFPLWGDLVRAEVGLDLRGRLLLPEGEDTGFQISLGAPISWIAETAGDRPQYARAEIGIRPGLGLLGESKMILNAHAQGRLGYTFVQADSVDLRSHLSYGFQFDNATAVGSFWAHVFGLAFSASF
jgi:hypothetical protein